MTRKTIHTLTAIVIGLLLLLLVLRGNDIDDKALVGQRLLPDFEAVANDITEVQLLYSAGVESITIRRKNDTWVIPERDDYAADVGKLRQLIVGLSDAEILEEKTANPEKYQNLGVDDPEAGGDGIKVVVTGLDMSHSVILGDVAQGNYRYARVAGESTSYLINQNPDVPRSSGDWLMRDIVDIDRNQVQRVVISHADGESIVIEKSDQAQTDFAVQDIPEGRELSYATVGNGIAGALGKLALEDVRAHIDAPSTSTVVFNTWDGLRVSAQVVSDDETSWISFSAELAGGESDDARAQVSAINERVSGWAYQLPDHKKNLLIRRWEDILKAID